MNRQDLTTARATLGARVRSTPALRLYGLEPEGIVVWAKLENLQWVGAFKARGAQYAVMCLSEQQRARGLVTFSSGNHAQAVALAAQRHGIPATIFMPEDAPAIKVEAVRRLGATVKFAGQTSHDRQDAALACAKMTGATVIQPFDDPNIIAGQGTATLEFIEQVRAEGGALDAIVVPVGGGGLIAGACLAAQGQNIAIHGVEPVGCDSMAQSLRAGHVVAVSPGPSLADGLRPTTVGELNFRIARDAGVQMHTTDDPAIGSALVQLLMCERLLVEPSAAAALAVALRELPGNPQHIGVILSGGNIAPAVLARLVEEHT